MSSRLTLVLITLLGISKTSNSMMASRRKNKIESN